MGFWIFWGSEFSGPITCRNIQILYQVLVHFYPLLLLLTWQPRKFRFNSGLSYLQHVPRNPTSATASLQNVGGLFMFVWVWSMLVAYHNVRDLHVYECLYENMYVHMLGWMSTALYVHVTHTQHTHIVTYTRVHVRTHHTIMNFPHDSSSTKSLSQLGRSIRITRTNQHFGIKSTILCPFTLFSFVLSFCVCAHVCIHV